ncbi:cytochrome ubiquinol oxidase subunit I [Streptomyces sp. NPDC051896]|uniref:cytochrome ubiquinol oxidase subunit I n=1 Tax=Streptomyces sp. NPDC051896 TaxID=3155416 RepID=UPI00341FAABF
MMAFTLASHIILVPLGVALPLITLIMHGYGLRRDDATALLLARRWSAVMAVQFARGAGAHTTLRWLAFVTLVAVVLVVPAVALLYWLDTHGELEGLSDADLRDDAVDEV